MSADEGLSPAPAWTGTSTDPNDEQFGDVVRTATVADADDYDAVLVGEPYDGAVIGRRGAREGPTGIRGSLAATKTHRFEAGPVGGGEGAVADLGDVDVNPGDPDVGRVQASVREVAAAVHATDATPVFLGGDNSLSFANAAPLLESGSLGVVSLDAHLDCREVVDGPSSGTPYRQLHEAGLDAFCVVGARDFETSTAYAEFVEDEGGEIVTAEAVGRDLDLAVDRARDAMDGVDAVYLSVDVDVLDAAAGPGCSAPTPGGLSARELFRLVRRLAGDDRVAGFEVVETAPPLDEDGRTSDAAARTVAQFLAGHLGGPDDKDAEDGGNR